jgi:hypothetical protein
MRTAEEIRPIILELYSEIGGDAGDICLIKEDFDYLQYRIVRNDDAVTTIERKYIDDYIDNFNRTAAKLRIIEALRKFTDNT